MWAWTTGSYLFKVNHDDGVRVYIDNELIVDAWAYKYGGNQWHEGSKYLDGNYGRGQWYPIRVEFFEYWGDATIKLYWKTPFGGTTYVIDSNYLRHK